MPASQIIQTHDAPTLPDEDLPLVQAAKDGSIGAFEDLVKRHARRMFQIAHSLLHNCEDAEDTVQEAFLKAFHKLSQFQAKSKFSIWLARITVNQAFTKFRKEPVGWSSLQDGPQDEAGPLPQEIVDWAPSPEMAYSFSELRKILGTNLRRLEASEALHAEEQVTWQKTVRVLGHEINNSLGPIKSIADTLALISAPLELPDSFKQNLQRGLEIIAKRSDSLKRFLQNYTKFTKLPTPSRRVVELRTILSEAIAMESRLPITTLPGPNVSILVDPDQLTQVFINLLRNAVDAVLDRTTQKHETDDVTVRWRVEGQDLQLWIRDRGIGLPDTENLFVPFYTTKSTGSGIGLVLSRQIIESHNGHLTIQNRKDGPGCEVNIKLPMCVFEKVASSNQLCSALGSMKG